MCQVSCSFYEVCNPSNIKDFLNTTAQSIRLLKEVWKQVVKKGKKVVTYFHLWKFPGVEEKVFCKRENM
jgi:hypothetical protein